MWALATLRHDDHHLVHTATIRAASLVAEIDPASKEANQATVHVAQNLLALAKLGIEQASNEDGGTAGSGEGVPYSRRV